MAELAARVGISRGTIYRYFATRRALLDALEATARKQASRQLADANLDQVPVDEALARAVRALVALEETYHFLARRPDPPLPQEPKYLEPIVALVGATACSGPTATA